MIYGYQQQAYESLRKSAIAHAVCCGIKLPVTPRFHRLLVGPTGTGKTFLAEYVAKELNFKTVVINSSGWIILGAKEKPTWHDLFQDLYDLDDGRPIAIILDEVDKADGQESWSRFIRSELFALIDRRLPFATCPIDTEDGTSYSDAFNTAKKALERAWVVGCGAFQDIWEETAKSMGFGEQKQAPKPNSDQLAKFLPRELVNRFHKDIIALPQPTKQDYESMVESTCSAIDVEVASEVKRLSEKAIPEAIENKYAARFIENLVCQAVESISPENYKWESPHDKTTKENGKKDPLEGVSLDEHAESLWNEQIPV